MTDSNPVAPPLLAYRTPTVAPPLPPAWRTLYAYAVLTCWAVPLVAGVVIWIASEVVRHRVGAAGPLYPSHGGPKAVSPGFTRLVDFGLLDLALGTIFAAVGAFAVLVFAVARLRTAVHPWRQVFGPALVWLALLASNFAVAAAVAGMAMR